LDAVEAFFDAVKAFFGAVKAFSGAVKAFFGAVKAFFGGVKAFFGAVKAFFGAMKAFSGGVKAFSEAVQAFFEGIEASEVIDCPEFPASLTSAKRAEVALEAFRVTRERDATIALADGRRAGCSSVSGLGLGGGVGERWA